MSRKLSAEDRAVWERVRASVTPLGREPAHPAPTASPREEVPLRRPVPTPSREPGPPAPAWHPPAFRVGERADPRRADALLPSLAEHLTGAPLRMDAGRHRRMTRGRLAPEARLDLHGMTLPEAHRELAGFLLESRARGRRLVLVITGKGRRTDDLAPLPARTGRLRHDVPRWMALPPLADAVLQIAPAHPRHGGEGALYVYLRA